MFKLMIIIPSLLLSFNDFYEIKKEPIQKKVINKTIKFKGYYLTTQYSFKMKARVVHAKRYSWDTLSNLITHDFGVTWGEISKTNIFNLFTWNQKDRFLIYEIREDYINKIGGAKYVNEHIANIHLIPKDWHIESLLNKVKDSDIIELEGYLVDINYSNKVIYTSISRSDSGPGACEVIFIRKFKILHSRSKNQFYYHKSEKIIDTKNLNFKKAGRNTRANRMNN